MDLKKRLNSIITTDKKTNPKYILEIIKSDFYYLINNYFEVDFNDISVSLDVENEQYKIQINSSGERLKMVKILPEY